MTEPARKTVSTKGPAPIPRAGLYYLLVSLVVAQLAISVGGALSLGWPLRWTRVAAVLLPTVAMLVFWSARRRRAAAGQPRGQFSLRELAVLVSLAAVWFAVLAKDRRDETARYHQRQRIEHSALHVIGAGQARFSGNEDRLMVVVKRPTFGDDDLARLLEDVQSSMERGGIYHLSLEGTAITDRGMALLASCRHLEHLHLDRTAVTDDGLARLGDLPKLRSVTASGTQVTRQRLLELNR